MKQILVKEVMTPAENVITISPYARVRELLALMQSKSVKSVVVERTSEHDAYGLVTYTSILNAIFAEDGDIDLINVYDIAAKPVLHVSGELDIRYATRLMVRYGVNRLVVMDSNRLAGLISMNDIVAVLMKDL